VDGHGRVYRVLTETESLGILRFLRFADKLLSYRGLAGIDFPRGSSGIASQQEKAKYLLLSDVRFIKAIDEQN
jgi:hypothetical protein